jgi:parallel beta-helix repeat protein
MPVWAVGTIYIRADGSIDPPYAPISTFDNMTYTLTGNITSNAYGIVVQRSNIIVDGDGYTLQGIGNGTGLLFSSIHNVTVQSTNIKNFETGIWLYFSSNNTVVRNNITANSGESVWLSSSSDNRIIGNTIASNGTAIHETGIYVEYSSNNNTISGNEITSINWFGIFVSASSNGNSITDNNVTSNTYGIWVSLSSDNSILGNRVSAGLTGFALLSCSNNSVSGNSMSNMELGILLEFSSYDNVVWRNNVTATTGWGIYLNSDAGNNTVRENYVAANAIGIGLSSSSDNSVYHNNFVDNTQQVESINSTNLWDNGYPSGGNYWSDYTGIDSNADGIGDSNYTIDANNNDMYPLMGMFYGFNVSWIEPGYNVELISNSSVSAFDVGFWIEHPEDPNTRIIKFNVTGETGTAGFCRICIPKALLSATYTVLINGTEIPFALLPCSSSTHSYLYFNYTHSTQEVIIIPEFPSFLILPLCMTASLLAMAICKRRRFHSKSLVSG